ncbi:MAG: AEC family transporter [Chloroflexi bacterium]|nr:MAG: AEC family transporter [Chloroflexota bacterium]
MSELLNLFTNNILPILLVASVGFVLQKLLKFDPRPLSQVTFYVLSPALVFTLLVSAEIEGGRVLSMMAFAALVVLLTAGLSFGVGRTLGLGGKHVAAFLLTTTFMNAGNYGLSLNKFAFGDFGLALASIYFVASQMMTHSLGVYIASVGGGGTLQAFKGLTRVPSVYAIPLALGIRALDIAVPLPISRPIELLSLATVPTMLLLLGMQIARAGVPRYRKSLSASVAIKLLAAPAIAFLIAPLIGLEGLARDVGILQSAMPTAVMTTIIATEYDAEAAFVTGAVLVTTLLSPLTLTPLIAVLLG